MIKILVLGAAGMAGHVVYTYLKELGKYDVIGTTNSNNLYGVNLKLDIFKIGEVENIIVEHKPNFIVNCIGMLIKTSITNPEQTIYGNAYFPHLLRKISNKHNIKLIHISTDCVFSGKDGKYIETSFKDATDIYGLSKNLGEIIDSENLTIRTSIIGPEIKNDGEGLFHWFMNKKGSVNGFKSNLWSGVTTLELSKFIDWVIDNPITGLVHLTNGNEISKYDLLVLINDIYQRKIQILDNKDYICDKSFINSNIDLGFKVPTYKVMLEEQQVFMNNHKLWYKY